MLYTRLPWAVCGWAREADLLYLGGQGTLCPFDLRPDESFQSSFKFSWAVLHQLQFQMPQAAHLCSVLLAIHVARWTHHCGRGRDEEHQTTYWGKSGLGDAGRSRIPSLYCPQCKSIVRVDSANTNLSTWYMSGSVLSASVVRISPNPLASR